jgi:prepilin-type N-terminal cleavage/methylation domain-containing protein
MHKGTQARIHEGSKGRGPARPRAFTLMELLVVIGIIVLVAIIAVPSFRALTGGRSTEAAQNQISAVLARARTEALGLEEPRGVLFYRDLETQRVGMTLVKATTLDPPYALDLVEGIGPVLLPQGVGIQFIDNYLTTGAGTPPPRADDGYIGFNTRVHPTLTNPANAPVVVPYGGVVLFDGRGQLVTAAFRFRVRYPDPDGTGPLTPRASELGKFLYDNPALAPNVTASQPELILPPPPSPTDTNPIFPPESKIGFVLFDAEEFHNIHGEGRTTAANTDTDTEIAGTTGNGAYAPEERNEETWLDQNAIPLLVNRYNGTLVRSE